MNSILPGWRRAAYCRGIGRSIPLPLSARSVRIGDSAVGGSNAVIQCLRGKAACRVRAYRLNEAVRGHLLRTDTGSASRPLAPDPLAAHGNLVRLTSEAGSSRWRLGQRSVCWHGQLKRECG